MRKPVFLLFLMMIFCSVVHANLYQITPEIKAEIKQYKADLVASPNSSHAKFNLAMSYAYTGQVEKGWVILKKIPESYAPVVIDRYLGLVKKEPNVWQHRFKLAFGYYFERDKDQALTQFFEILKQHPDHIWAMGYIALLKGEQGKTDEAILWCKKAISIEPNAAAIHFLLAEAYRRKGEVMKALQALMAVGKLKTQEKLSGAYND